ncbi:CLUMA_CG004825, isoform A [Clunio marinus]|uniref:CLUMA_CG004825, isoform A n=1 Tax=Clunio marinus TaxID=568069 RepID=A0A1J1HT16_9DIPT|nr:CLUMA_CG004825, isoform A [Clunio marinus]
MNLIRFIFATAFCSSVLSFELNCLFRRSFHFLVWREIYGCDCWVVHTTGNTIALEDLSRNLQQFPSNFDHFFPNLFDIFLAPSGLTTITAEDLKPFPALIRLEIPDNRIQHVEGNLFQHTPNMRAVGFSFNSIETVGLGLFEGLRGFTAPGSLVSFLGNTCISESANGPEQIAILIQNLERDCLPPITTTTTTEAAVDECPSSCRTLIDSFASRIEQLEMQMKEILGKLQV